MLSRWLGLGASLALLGSAPALGQALNIEDVARIPAVSGVSMSAEGDTLIGIVADPRNPDARALATWNISGVDGTKPLAVTSVTPGNSKMGFIQASALKAGKVIAIASQAWTGNLNGCGEGKVTGATKTYLYKFYLTDNEIQKFDDPFSGGRAVGVSDETQRCLEIGSSPGIIDLPLDPENVILVQTDAATLQGRYSKVNLKTGKTEFLFRESGASGIGLLDPRDGTIRTRSKVEPLGNNEYEFQTLVLNPETKDFDLEGPLTVGSKDRRTVDIAGYDESTGKYYVLTDKFADKVEVYLYDAKTDTFDKEPLFKHADFDASGVVLSRRASNFGQLLGFRYNAGDTETYWIDPEMKSIQDGLNATFKGQTVSFLDMTQDLSKILFVADGPRHAPSYYLLVNKSKLLGVGGERPTLKPASLGERTLVYYEARDGLKIPGFLTLPPNFKKGDPAPPAIVLPHGGPWARDFVGWDSTGWTQFLATRGYAVLQPQYRGSTGWGHTLWTAGDAEWGQKMQDDKDDGAEWMIREGYAARGRVAIFGYSYGGFAAFAASVRPNGPFKCAIAGAGVSNLTRIGNNWGESRLQRGFQGRTVKGMDPMQNADKLAMPILIYHGDRDVRVPLFHATDFHNAVKGTGKSKLVVLKDMGHQLDKWTPENHRDSLAAIETFLKNDCQL